jgi:hypothetical protein
MAKFPVDAPKAQPCVESAPRRALIVTNSWPLMRARSSLHRFTSAHNYRTGRSELWARMIFFSPTVAN